MQEKGYSRTGAWTIDWSDASAYNSDEDYKSVNAVAETATATWTFKTTKGGSSLTVTLSDYSTAGGNNVISDAVMLADPLTEVWRNCNIT